MFKLNEVKLVNPPETFIKYRYLLCHRLKNGDCVAQLQTNDLTLAKMFDFVVDCQ